MLKKFKSLFIIEEGQTTSEAQNPVEKGANPQKDVPTPTRSFQVPAGSTGPGKVQDKFLEVLFDALEANNQEGFDYMEFREFLLSLTDVHMEEEKRYKSAFATAQTIGATKEKILNSARHYLEILSREQSKFQEALGGQRDRNLTGKQNEIKQLEQTIKNKEAEIEKLKSDLVVHRQQIGSLEQEINTASEKLSQTANDFEASYQSLLGQIQLDVKNIESNL